jgi:hypothetical protein
MKTSQNKLWGQVQDMLGYFGCGDGRLSKCKLDNDSSENAYILHTPKDLIAVVEMKLDDIEDAFEQMLGEHQVSVYPVVTEEKEVEERKADEPLCRQTNNQKE